MTAPGERYELRRHATLFTRPSVLLSASIVELSRRDEARHAPAPPATVQDAVVQLTRGVLRHGWNLVCGGHPWTTPLLLGVAAEFQAQHHGRVICFQSEEFLGQIPQATFGLWKHGHVLRTERKGKLAASLAHMRAQMIQVPSLAAAGFVGGMKGVADEAELVARRLGTPPPCYALPGTGSAAADLFERDPKRFSGGSSDLEHRMPAARGQVAVARRVVRDIAGRMGGRP